VTLDEFLVAPTPLYWVREPSITAYVEKRRGAGALGLVSVHVREGERRTRVFDHFLMRAERLAQAHGYGQLVVADVLNPVLLPYLERRGYRSCGRSLLPGAHGHYGRLLHPQGDLSPWVSSK
jgi:hypothetical protein